MSASGMARFLDDLAAVKPHPSDICLSCDDASAVKNGFCAKCLNEIEGIFDLEHEPMTGRIHFGIFLPDQYGGSPE